MSLPANIFPVPTVLSTELEAETILLDMSREHYFSLAGSGSSFWRLIQADSTVDNAIAALLAEYDVDEAALRHDMKMLWQQLAEQGLATSTPPAA